MTHVIVQLLKSAVESVFVWQSCWEVVVFAQISGGFQAVTRAIVYMVPGLCCSLTLTCYFLLFCHTLVLLAGWLCHPA